MEMMCLKLTQKQPICIAIEAQSKSVKFQGGSQEMMGGCDI